jgi:Tol biopolymer transport system component
MIMNIICVKGTSLHAVTMIIGLAATLISQTSCAKHDVFPELKGPYLGHRPPRNIPELFPCRISADLAIDSIPLFAKEGCSLIFKGSGPSGSALYLMELKGGTWTRPLKMFPLSRHEDRHFFIAPDGGRLFFTSRRPLQPGGNETEDPNIWSIKVNSSDWSSPKPLPNPINTPRPEFYSTTSLAGTLFFSGYSDGSNCDILYSPSENGEYIDIKNAGPAINTVHVDGDPYIAPDESYLIFLSNRPGGFGQHDFYVSFRKADGSWTIPDHFDKAINSEANDVCPLVSPDGRVFFFSSNRTGSYEIYWVDANVIDDMKPEN